eukprot:g6025.t1
MGLAESALDCSGRDQDAADGDGEADRVSRLDSLFRHRRTGTGSSGSRKGSRGASPTEFAAAASAAAGVHRLVELLPEIAPQRSCRLPGRTARKGFVFDCFYRKQVFQTLYLARELGRAGPVTSDGGGVGDLARCGLQPGDRITGVAIVPSSLPVRSVRCRMSIACHWIHRQQLTGLERQGSSSSSSSSSSSDGGSNSTGGGGGGRGGTVFGEPGMAPKVFQVIGQEDATYARAASYDVLHVRHGALAVETVKAQYAEKYRAVYEQVLRDAGGEKKVKKRKPGGGRRSSSSSSSSSGGGGGGGGGPDPLLAAAATNKLIRILTVEGDELVAGTSVPLRLLRRRGNVWALFFERVRRFDDADEQLYLDLTLTTPFAASEVANQWDGSCIDEWLNFPVGSLEQWDGESNLLVVFNTEYERAAAHPTGGAWIKPIVADDDNDDDDDNNDDDGGGETFGSRSAAVLHMRLALNEPCPPQLLPPACLDPGTHKYRATLRWAVPAAVDHVDLFRLSYKLTPLARKRLNSRSSRSGRGSGNYDDDDDDDGDEGDHQHPGGKSEQEKEGTKEGQGGGGGGRSGGRRPAEGAAGAGGRAAVPRRGAFVSSSTLTAVPGQRLWQGDDQQERDPTRTVELRANMASPMMTTTAMMGDDGAASSRTSSSPSRKSSSSSDGASPTAAAAAAAAVAGGGATAGSAAAAAAYQEDASSAVPEASLRVHEHEDGSKEYEFVLDSLSPGREYTVEIELKNHAGWGPKSAASEAFNTATAGADADYFIMGQRLNEAVRQGNLDVIEDILVERKCSPSLWGVEGMPVLHMVYAVQRRQRNRRAKASHARARIDKLRRAFLTRTLFLLRGAVVGAGQERLRFVDQCGAPPRRTAAFEHVVTELFHPHGSAAIDLGSAGNEIAWLRTHGANLALECDCDENSASALESGLYRCAGRPGWRT